MHTIELKGGYKALVDDEDKELVSKYHWYPDIGAWTNYAKTDHLPGRPRLHQVIMKPPKGMYVDHLDRNGLNNQRSNLEIVTPSINRFRSKIPLGQVPFRGVHIHVSGRYCAEITVQYKKHYLGLFNTPEEAHAAYLLAAKNLR